MAHAQRVVTFIGDLCSVSIPWYLHTMGCSCTSYLLPADSSGTLLPAGIFYMLMSQSLLQNVSGSHTPPCSPARVR